MAILETRQLSKHFGGLAAVSELDMEVREGEILSVIGPNGAGKTTLFNVVTGYMPPTAGKVFFGGEDITGLSPNRIAERGLVRTFQETVLFARFPVIAHILTGLFMDSTTTLWETLLNTPWWFQSFRRKRAESLQKAAEILEFLGLKGSELMLATNLPHGHQRLLGLGIALAANPKLLLMDEPVTGMNVEEANFAMSLMRGIRERGITVVLVEHDMRTVMDISDRIVVLNYGRKIAEGTPSEIRANQEVIDAYLGVEEDVA